MEKGEHKEDRDGFSSGLRVLDLAEEKASFCSRLLADLGACVIKVERPGGDPSRSIGPFWENSPHPKRSLSFYYNNANKLGITLNLEHPEGKKIFFKLVTRSDIVVESFPPGYLKELGFDFEVLKEINPGLILVSVTGFGQSGPRSQYKSCDLVASAYGGQMYVTGSPSMPPLKACGEQSYYTSSLFAAVGILLALRKRRQSGKGDHIDISLQDAIVSTLDHVLVRYFSEGTVARRQGNRSWNGTSFIAPCRDGHLYLTLSPWETLVEWMASEGLADDLVEERWKDERYRLQHVDHIVDVVGKCTRTHSTHELFELGQLMRFPWAPVYSPREVLGSPQLQARNFFLREDPREGGRRMPLLNIPFKLSHLRSIPQKSSPSPGEHNIQIYRDELGFSAEDMERLSFMKVI